MQSQACLGYATMSQSVAPENYVATSQSVAPENYVATSQSVAPENYTATNEFLLDKLFLRFRYHDHRLHVALIEQLRGKRLDLLWRDGVDRFDVAAMVVLAVKILGAQNA